MLRTSPLEQRSVNVLNACLGSEDVRGLRYAVALLDETKAAAADFLADLLHSDLQRFRHSRRQQAKLAGLTIALFMLAQARLLLNWHIPPLCGLLCLAPGVLMMQSLIARSVAQRMIRRRMLNVLFLMQEQPCVAHIGVFVDVLRYGDSDLSYLAQERLVQTLPHLQNADLLTPAQHAALCKALRGTNANLILAILTAFRYAGVNRSRPAVRRLTSCPAWLANARQIENAADACLQEMNKRAAERQIARTLLRAQTSATYSTAFLLRAAEPAGLAREIDLPSVSAAGSEIRDGAVLLQTLLHSGEET